MTVSVRPRIYLDIDGVLIAEKPAFETVPLNAIENYSPEVVRRLGNTGLELVWLTTWEQEAVHSFEHVATLQTARVLKLARTNDDRTIRKRLALIEEQRASPSPFVWIDDETTERDSALVHQTLKVPKLLIQPDKDTGINQFDLARVEDFAQEYHRAA